MSAEMCKVLQCVKQRAGKAAGTHVQSKLPMVPEHFPRIFPQHQRRVRVASLLVEGGTTRGHLCHCAFCRTCANSSRRLSDFPPDPLADVAPLVVNPQAPCPQPSKDASSPATRAGSSMTKKCPTSSICVRARCVRACMCGRCRTIACV